MKKIIIPIFTIIFLSFCVFLLYEIKKISEKDMINNSWSIKSNSWVILDNSSSWALKEKKKDKLEILWDTHKEVINSFYSNDKNKKEEINNWLSDKKNERTTEKWDIIEFLDYCEKLSNINNKNELIEFITKKWDRADINKLISSKDFITYNKSFELIKKSNYIYKWIDYWIIWQYILDKEIKKNDLALYSISSILSYYVWLISKDEVIKNLKEDTKSYNLLYIKYIEASFIKKIDCKEFIEKNPYDKWIQEK